jgi:hypothetical protein
MIDLVNVFRGVILDDPHTLERVQNVLGSALHVVGIPLASPLMPYNQEADRPSNRCQSPLPLGLSDVPGDDLLGVSLKCRAFAPMFSTLVDVVVEGGELLVDAKVITRSIFAVVHDLSSASDKYLVFQLSMAASVLMADKLAPHKSQWIRAGRKPF